MERTTQQGTLTQNDAKNQRAFPRYPVSIDATLHDGSGKGYTCRVRNVCIGGMYIVFTEVERPSFTSLVQGGSVRLAFSIDVEGGRKPVQIEARVLRYDEQSIGIAFINPDLSVVQSILAFAAERKNKPEDAVLQQQEQKLSAHGISSSTHEKIRSQCDVVIQETLDEVLKKTFSAVHDKLFDLSGEAEHFQVASQYYNGATIIKEKSKQATSDIKNAMSALLSTKGGAGVADPSVDALSSTDLELSLVQDDDLEDFIVGADTVNTIEIRNKEALTLLAANLTILHQQKVTDENNPYSAKLFVDCFQNAIKDLNLDSLVVRVCYAAFKEALIKSSKKLYVSLNDVFAKHGIKASINDPVKKTIQQHSPSDQIQNASPVATNDSQVIAPSLEQAMKDEPVLNDAPQQEKQIAPVADVLPVQGHDSPTVQHTSGEVNEKNLYQVVGELLELRQSLKKQSSSFVTNKYTVKDCEVAEKTKLEVYETEEIIKAIDEIKSDKENNLTTAITESVTDKLRDAAHGEEKKVIRELSHQDAEVLEISDGLFEAMLYDPCVDQSVKPWIKELKHPIAKLALRDNSVFIDKSHIVRNVIDKISQLEYCKEGDKVGAAPQSLQKVIGQLIQKANHEFDGTDQVFHKINGQLDKISKIQQQAYQDNIEDVRKCCDEECPAVELQYTEEERQWLDDEAEWERWLKYASRIKEGDWVSYKVDASENRKLRLAWKDSSGEVFVFVNYLGLLSLTISLQDLALHLFYEKVILLDSADEPAVDRAQLTMLQKLHGQLLHQTTHDQLTDLINRREFERILQHSINSAKQDNVRHAVCFIDIDNFSVVNDSCGYSGGDRLLKELSQLMKEVVAEQGVVARLGSDQFGLLLKKCSIDQALAQVEDLLEAVFNFKFEQDEKTFSVAVSIGMIQVNNQSNTPSSLLQAAEASSSIAKEAGGNRLQLYHSGLARVTQRNELMKWVGVVDKMIETDSFLLRCQRIESIHKTESQELPVYEILLSIIDDNKKILLPQKFIEAAEVYNRMANVDRWVVHNVLGALAEHLAVLDEIGAFAIKLSKQSILDEGFVEFVAGEISNTQIPANKICFELAESAGIDHLSDAASFINEIKSIGCQCVLDDFGNGNSSYRCLKQLPFDYLKIDGSFVKELKTNDNDYAVVKSICEVAHFMNKKVIAEYVEGEEILEKLKQIGVDFVQGYYIEQPKELKELFVV